MSSTLVSDFRITVWTWQSFYWTWVLILLCFWFCTCKTPCSKLSCHCFFTKLGSQMPTLFLELSSHSLCVPGSSISLWTCMYPFPYLSAVGSKFSLSCVSNSRTTVWTFTCENPLPFLFALGHEFSLSFVFFFQDDRMNLYPLQPSPFSLCTWSWALIRSCASGSRTTGWTCTRCNPLPSLSSLLDLSPHIFLILGLPDGPVPTPDMAGPTTVVRLRQQEHHA